VADGARFAVSGGERTIEVVFERGYPYAQVFAPPDQEFICFEPMAAPTNALESGDGLRSVQPGDSFEAAFAVRVL
jgi:aldose 1-epimerase